MPAQVSSPRSLRGSIVLVTGAASGMGAATARLFAAEGARVAIASPGYPPYRHILTALGCEPVMIETTAETRWEITSDALLAAHRHRPLKGVLVASPANPTGTTVAAGELDAEGEPVDAEAEQRDQDQRAGPPGRQVDVAERGTRGEIRTRYPTGDDQRRGFGRDAAVDLDVDRTVADECLHAAHFIDNGGDEGLAAEAGIDCHEQDEVEAVEDVLDDVDRCRRIQ